LDYLAPDDPRAVRSRRDLVLINAMMRQSAIMAKALSRHPAPRVLADLGGGDGVRQGKGKEKEEKNQHPIQPAGRCGFGFDCGKTIKPADLV